MEIFTNPIFWLIIGLILALMFIIGYLAETLGLDKKKPAKTAFKPTNIETLEIKDEK